MILVAEQSLPDDVVTGRPRPEPVVTVSRSRWDRYFRHHHGALAFEDGVILVVASAFTARGVRHKIGRCRRRFDGGDYDYLLASVRDEDPHADDRPESLADLFGS